MSISNVKWWFLILSFLWVPQISFGQNDEWANFNEGSIVYSIKADNDLIWIGTRGGLVRYNTQDKTSVFYNKTTSGLPDNRVTTIAIDKAGRKWLGTWNGIGIFDGDDWMVYDTSNSLLPDNVIIDIKVAPDSAVWIITGLGYLLRVKEQAWTTYSPSQTGITNGYESNLTIENDTVIWIAGWSDGLVRFDGTNWQTFTESNSELLPGAKVYDVNFIGDTMWLAATSCLIRIIDTTWTVFTHPDFGQSASCFSRTFRDRTGNFWIGTCLGIIRIDPNNQQTIFTTSNSGLSCDNVWQIEQDQTGTMWFGTFGRGAATFNNSIWEIPDISETDLVNNFVTEMTFDHDTVLWGISPNIDCSGSYHSILFSYDMNSQTWKSYSKTEMGLEFYDNDMKSVMVDSLNNKWFLAEGGLLKYDNSSWQFFKCPDSLIASLNHLLFARCGKGGTIFIFTDDGLLTYHSGTWIFRTMAHLGFTATYNFFQDACIDPANNLWFIVKTVQSGDRRSLLVKYDGLNYSSVQTPFTTENDVAGRCAAGPDGDIWLSYSSGILMKYDGVMFTTLVDSQDFGIINHLNVDPYNNIWISTIYSSGLYKYSPSGSLVNYNLDNSGISDEFVNYVAFDVYNNKWIGVTHSGISVFNENGITLPEIPNEAEVPDSTGPCLFPNPANDYVNLNLASFQFGEVVQVVIYDLLGKKIQTFTYLAEDRLQELNISDIRAGMYLFRVNSLSKKDVYKLVIL